MRLRRINNIVHRDLGYFFAGTTLIYAVSGLAVNHVDDWNPSFVVHRDRVDESATVEPSQVTKQWVMDVLTPPGARHDYRSHDFPSEGKVKIYLDDGSLFINLVSGEGEYEVVKRRPVLYQFNRLHLSPRRAWLVFSDVFAGGLVVITLTGLFIHKGKYGLTGRCMALTTAGVLVPLAFILFV